MRKLLMMILSVWFLASFATTPALSDPEFPEGPTTPPAEVPSSQKPSDEPPDPPQKPSDKRTEEDQETTIPDTDRPQPDHTPVVQEPQEPSDKHTEEDQETTVPDTDQPQPDHTDPHTRSAASPAPIPRRPGWWSNSPHHRRAFRPSCCTRPPVPPTSR